MLAKQDHYIAEFTVKMPDVTFTILRQMHIMI